MSKDSQPERATRHHGAQFDRAIAALCGVFSIKDPRAVTAAAHLWEEQEGPNERGVITYATDSDGVRFAELGRLQLSAAEFKRVYDQASSPRAAGLVDDCIAAAYVVAAVLAGVDGPSPPPESEVAKVFAGKELESLIYFRAGHCLGTGGVDRAVVGDAPRSRTEARRRGIPMVEFARKVRALVTKAGHRGGPFSFLLRLVTEDGKE